MTRSWPRDFGMAEQGGQVDKLFPWEVSVDVSSLAPGEYTFVATNDDPSGGEGFAPDSDSKNVRHRVGPCCSAGSPECVGRAPGSGG